MKKTTMIIAMAFIGTIATMVFGLMGVIMTLMTIKLCGSYSGILCGILIAVGWFMSIKSIYDDCFSKEKS